jgi:CheY-like chemotaxis protein
VESLRELGYTVLHADDGEAALRTLEATPQVDLLFTDIVMPGMNGRELATEAERRHPELKVLYTSGYVPNAVVHNATLGPLEDLISKPFSIDQLARKVRQVFDLPMKKAAAVPA